LTTENAAGASSQTPCVVLMVDPAMNRQLVAPVKGVIQGYIERRRVMAVIPQRIKDAFARMSEKAGEMRPYVADVEKEFAGLLDLKERGGANDDSGLLALTVPKGFGVERRPTTTEQNVPGYGYLWCILYRVDACRELHQRERGGTFLRILGRTLPKGALLIGKAVPYYV